MMNYFVVHLNRLDYRGRLASGEAIGSGAVERAAKTLGLRLKARGARWRHKKRQGDGSIDLLSPYRTVGPVLEPGDARPKNLWAHLLTPGVNNIVRSCKCL